MTMLFLGLLSVLVSSCFPNRAACSCYEPTPAFPPPKWEDGPSDLKPAFDRIEKKIHDISLIIKEKFERSSYSIEITSSSESLWTAHHTAKVLDKTRPGDKQVSSRSQFRIASITKAFTTLALLQLASDQKLSLDDPVVKYIPELNSSDYDLPWKDTSLRILASQLSGLPREFAQGDLLNLLKDPIASGLPPVSEASLPSCDEYNAYNPCKPSDLLERLKTAKPLFAPNQKSSYSNVNYEILGLVIANVAGVPYEQHIVDTILKPLGMNSSSFETPSDEFAVLPVMEGDRGNYWDVQEGVQNPTGGLYSSSADLAKFVRYILTHFNALTTGVNWLLPASWGTGMETFYGMPFEIFRTDKILKHSRRPVTFVTKSGGYPGYYSKITVLEDYGLGFTILVGGDLSLLDELAEIISVELVRGAEATIWKKISKTYHGTFTATDTSLNSSIELASSPSKGIHLTNFISNGTQVLPGLFTRFDDPRLAEGSLPWHAQLVPTLLFKNDTSQEGEIWRVLAVRERSEGSKGIWDEFCPTDIDQLSYAGLPFNEIVFWHEKGVIELPAWRVTMKRSEKKVDDSLVLQG